MSVDGRVDEQSVYTNDGILVSNTGDPVLGLVFDWLPQLLLQTVLSNLTCDFFSADTEGANFL